MLSFLLVASAFGVVLAGVDSPLFDLDRHAVPKELVLHVAAFLALLVLARSDLLRVEGGVVAVLLAGFLAWSAVSTLLATNHWLALRGFAITFSGLVVFGAARHVASRRSVEPILIGFVIAAALGALSGSAQAYGFAWDWLDGNRPPGGTFGNRNFLAHVLAIAFPCTLYLVAIARPGRAAPGLLVIAAMAGTIVLTRSRAAWLAVVCALFLMAAMVRFGRRSALPALHPARMIAAGCAILAGVLAAALVPNRLEWRSDAPYAETLAGLANYREGSGRGRLIQYGNSLRLAAENPLFGVGPGNWFVHYPRVTTPNDPAFDSDDPLPTNPWPSSDWVAFGAERGIGAVVLLLFAGLACGITALRRVRAGDAAESLRAIALLGTLAAVFLCGLFDAVLLLAAPACFAFGLIGLMMPATRPVLSRPLEGRTRTIVLALAFALSVIAVLASTTQLAAIVIAGDGDDRQAANTALRFDPGNHRLRLIQARAGPCAARLPHARAAARLLPHHAAPRRALAACEPSR